MTATLKSDIVSHGKNKTPYARKGDRVTLLKEHKGKDGIFYLCERNGDKFHVKISQIIFNG